MTDKYICKIEGCEYDGKTLSSLRSHVSATKEEDHQQARKSKAWEEWYPDEEGADPSEEGGSTPSDEGIEDPSDDDLDDDPSEPTDDEGDDGGSTTPSEGGPDPSQEYEEQWSTDDTASSSEETEGSEGGTDPSSGGSDRATGEGNGIGTGAALVAGSALVGLIVLLTRKDDDQEPIEVASTAEDVDPDEEEDSTPSEGGFSTVEGGDGW